MVGIGMHVDDVITMASAELIEDWNKFLLYYIFKEAGIISSPLKNSTGATTEVEFNGFMIGKQ